jgi:polar amino acid transport system substrate-binding protein
MSQHRDAHEAFPGTRGSRTSPGTRGSLKPSRSFGPGRSLRLTAAALAAVAVLVSAGCAGSGVYATTPVPAPVKPSSTPTASATTKAPDCGNPVASFKPDGPNPEVSGPHMDAIKKRGRLIAGVSADTMLLGARNPLSGKIEGFDIEMLRAVSKAIFDDPDKIEFKVITTAQRIPALTEDVKNGGVEILNGGVDIVARAMTITCTRWEKIDFSTEYYRAGQKVLVAKGATVNGLPVKTMADLKGKKVCAPIGTTSMDKLRTFPGLIPVGSDTHTGCLVLFQQGKADAITGDDSILAGLAAQDPYASVVNAPAFTAEPYGLGVPKEPGTHGFAKFVNAVLAQMRSDGEWKTAYNSWLKDALGDAPRPPAAVYGRPE